MIQLREMPQGQWVAFEGFETVHDCGKEAPRGKRPKTRRRVSGDPKRAREKLRETLSDGIHRRQVVRIVYTSKHRGFSDRTVRDIEPLSFSAGVVNAHCRLRGALRHFRMDRIHSAELTGETFTTRPGLSETYTAPRADVSPYAGSSAYRQGEGQPSVRGDGEVEARREQGLGVGCWVLIVIALLLPSFAGLS